MDRTIKIDLLLVSVLIKIALSGIAYYISVVDLSGYGCIEDRNI